MSLHSPAVADAFPTQFGSYQLLSRLGHGAMCEVFLGRPIGPDRGLPTPVVVKRLLPELLERPAFVERFKHEGAIAGRIRSPHVAQVYEIGAVGPALYLTMELVEGWPFKQVLSSLAKRARRPTVPGAVALVDGALAGLEALHEARDARGEPLGIVHRDLSPNNVMLRVDGTASLIDLGLGRSKLQTWKTRTGAVLGSPGYMPPEQVIGDRVDHRADLYAMAVLLWELLVVNRYVVPGSVAETLERSARPSFRRPSGLRPDVPAALDAVLERALSIQPEARYPSARALRAALAAAVPPSRAVDPALQQVVREQIAPEVDQRRAELRALLRAAEGVSGEESVELLPTVIGTAPGVEPYADTVQRPSPYALTMTHPGAAPVSGESFDIPVSAPPRPARLRSVAVGIGMAAFVLLVFAAGVGFERARRVEPELLPSVPAPAPSGLTAVAAPAAPPSSTVGATVGATPDPAPSPAVDPAPEPAPTREERPRPRPRPTARPEPTPSAAPSAPVAVDQKARLDALLGAARKAHAGTAAGTPAREAAESILADLGLLRAVPDGPRLAASLDRIERRLHELR